MLPNKDNKGKFIPAVYVDSGSEDLAVEAKRRAMSRFINAVAAQNLDEALDAFGDLKGLSD